MIVPEFIRFYGYTAEQVLDELAVRFFSLVNSMYRLQARESLVSITNHLTASAGGDEAQKTIEALHKQEKGLTGVLQEVETLREVRDV